MADATDARLLALQMANSYAMGLGTDIAAEDVVRRARRYHQFLTTEPQRLNRTTSADPTAVDPQTQPQPNGTVTP